MMYFVSVMEVISYVLADFKFGVRTPWG